MKIKGIAAAFWLVSSGMLCASTLGDYVRCGAELLSQSRGKLIASRSLPGWFALPQHTGIDVFFVAPDGRTQATAYVLPEKALLTDGGDRAFFLRVPTQTDRPLLLSLTQTLEGDWLTENSVPNAADEDKYTSAMAVNSISEAATRHLYTELLARLADVPRYNADWNRRFPQNPRPVHLAVCEKMGAWPRALSSTK